MFRRAKSDGAAGRFARLVAENRRRWLRAVPERLRRLGTAYDPCPFAKGLPWLGVGASPRQRDQPADARLATDP